MGCHDGRVPHYQVGPEAGFRLEDVTGGRAAGRVSAGGAFSWPGSLTTC